MPAIYRFAGPLYLFIALSSLSFCRAAPPAPVFDPVIDSPMYHLPVLPKAQIELVQAVDLNLWLRTLRQPEAEMKCKVAQSIVLAHERGVRGLEAAIEPMVAILDQPDAHPTVRLAIARALVALDARQAAPSLFRLAQSCENDLRAIIEPVLAQWNYAPAHSMWLERLRDREIAQEKLLLAIQALGKLKSRAALEPLRKILADDTHSSAIRLESARALALYVHEGLEEDAKRLSSESSARGIASHLAAAHLLRKHSGAAAIDLLQQFVRDDVAAVAVVAADRLLEIDPQLLAPVAEQNLLKNKDAGLRLRAIKALRHRPKPAHLRLVADHLDDLDLDVRQEARSSLLNLAGDKQYRAPIIEHASQVLAKDEWRGIVQAAILLTQLDHKPTAARLVELLSFKREEVQVTAAWGLRKLAVPSTLPAVVRFVVEATKIKPQPGGRSGGMMGPPPSVIGPLDHALSQLNQLLGQQKYQPAEEALRLYVPKHVMGNEARAAAVWALGMLHEGKDKVDDALVNALQQRLTDSNSLPPEDRRVRWMSAIALGRMKAAKALPGLRQCYPAQRANDDWVNNASGWAIEKITKEVMAPPLPIRRLQRDWFLVPNR